MEPSFTTEVTFFKIVSLGPFFPWCLFSPIPEDQHWIHLGQPFQTEVTFFTIFSLGPFFSWCLFSPIPKDQHWFHKGQHFQGFFFEKRQTPWSEARIKRGHVFLGFILSRRQARSNLCWFQEVFFCSPTLLSLNPGCFIWFGGSGWKPARLALPGSVLSRVQGGQPLLHPLARILPDMSSFYNVKLVICHVKTAC
jgi:hypothetical protein